MTTLQPSSSVEIAGYTGGSIAAKAGQFVRVVDLEGAQVGDLFAVAVGNHDEFMSPSVTRLHNSNLFPRIGQSFFTTLDRQILTFTKDHSPGFHDMLYASCNGR